MIGDVRVPKTKLELIKSIQSIQRLDFDVIETTNQSDRRTVITSLDKRLRSGSVSVILIQEK
jgi:hypothetical protein